MSEATGKKHNCETCKWHAYYERSPKSIIGRIWKWHTKWCPGWKAYQASLNQNT